MIVSTTDKIEGSKIKDYLGVVSGTDIYLVGGLFGGGLVNQENLYTQALNSAIRKMEEKARDLGANAIIGVSTNTVSPGELNNIIVIVTGTAVFTQEVTAPEEKTKRESNEKAEKKTESTKRPISNTNQNVVKKEIATFPKVPENNSNNVNDYAKKKQEQREELQNILTCPQCGEDLAFMGWDYNDLNEMQTCPLCGKEILLKQ